MAKWGEGDPRWIVEERADATNVNNWHWTEKNATNWSKDKFNEYLGNWSFAEGSCFVEIKELTKIEGEASANNRKAKLIFFYEWVIKADWQGQYGDDDKTYKGKLEIPNLSDENDIDEIEIEVTTEDSTDNALKLKEFMRKKGASKIRELLEKYLIELKEEFSQGMILPSQKDGKAKPNTSAPKTENKVKQQMNSPVATSNSNKSNAGVKIKCKKISGKQEFKCESEELYRALTDKDMVAAFSRGPVELEAEKGGRFSLFDGNVSGEFTKLERPKKICMRWRFKTWPDAHYSEVTLDFEQKDTCTELILTQTGVPENEYEKTKNGWKQYYWEAIKQTFGFGARLF